MPLVTFADLHAPAVSDRTKPVFALVETRIHDDSKPMPQPPNPRLDAADLATLDAWVAAGAPAGEACDGGAGSPEGGAPALSCTPDTHIAPASPWAMPTSESEAYVCYGFDVSVSAKRHITAMAPRLDDASILHHIVLLEADASVSPVPAECPLGGSTTWRPVFGWAPGGGSFELPPEAGFPEDATTHFVVQLHYVNLDNAPGHSDASGFDLCTTGELRSNDADVMAFGTTNIAIPPLATLTESCAVQVPWWGASTHLFAAFPHMHKLGDAIATTAVPGDGGAAANLGAVASWSFGAQGWIPISYDLVPGDTVDTSCTWTNTTDEEVTFGELSTNEMCYSFTMYYPKITSAAWSWAYPALYSVCSSQSQ
jgi:copper type II ascorbate-dependent monooxygenase-like protein